MASSAEMYTGEEMTPGEVQKKLDSWFNRMPNEIAFKKKKKQRFAGGEAPEDYRTDSEMQTTDAYTGHRPDYLAGIRGQD